MAEGTVDVGDLFTGVVDVNDPLAGSAEYTVQGEGTLEVGAKVSSEFAGRLKVVVTGEAEAQVQMAGKGAVAGVAELTGEMRYGVAAANEGEGKVGFAGLVESKNESALARDGDVKLEMSDLSIFTDAAQVAAEVTGQGTDERAVQVPAAAMVDRGGDFNRPHDEVAQDSGQDHRMTADTHPRRRVSRAECPGRCKRPRSGRPGRRITGGHPVNVHNCSPPARPRRLRL